MPHASQIFSSYSIGCGDAAALVLQVRVRIDQSRQHILAGRVDLDRVRHRRGRAGRRRASERDGIERDELRDHSVLEHDVERSFGRRAVAVDDDRVANDQPRRGECR